MILIYLPVLLTVLFSVLYFYFTRNYNYWKKRNVVGPKPIPLFGNLKESALRKKNVLELLHDYYKMFPNEKVVGIYRMTTPCLLIRDLDIIKHIMIKDFALFKDRGINFSKKGLGQNLFHADADTWSVLRMQFSPLFTPGKLKNMFNLLSTRGDIFMNHLEKTSWPNPEREVHSLVQKYTMSAIFACAFGVEFDDFNFEIDILKTVDRLTVTPNVAIELDMMYPGILNKIDRSLFPVGVNDFFENLVTNIISQRNDNPSNKHDFMDLILELRQKQKVTGSKTFEGNGQMSVEITDSTIAAQAFIFFVGGYETSATTMAYLLYILAMRPEIQDKLREEVDNVMKAYNGEISYDALNEMKYLEKVFLETLRMYPIVDLQRKAKINYKIPGTDVVIEKDQIVLISAKGVHYDENNYPNPEVFDPHRFDPELVANRHPCAFLPFGVGPRNCIGLRFGALQSRLCIAKIISKFRVEPNENTKMSLSMEPNRIINGPKEKILLNIVPRKDLSVS